MLLGCASLSSWVRRIVACVGNCFGCAKPTPIIAVDEPSKGLKIQGHSIKQRSLSEDFWSTSPHEMEISAMQSQRSMSSISTAAQSCDQHGAGSSSNPDEFVNQGLLLWNQTRQQWVGNRRLNSQRQKPREPKIGRHHRQGSLGRRGEPPGGRHHGPLTPRRPLGLERPPGLRPVPARRRARERAVACGGEPEPAAGASGAVAAAVREGAGGRGAVPAAVRGAWPGEGRRAGDRGGRRAGHPGREEGGARGRGRRRRVVVGELVRVLPREPAAPGRRPRGGDHGGGEGRRAVRDGAARGRAEEGRHRGEGAVIDETLRACLALCP